VLQREPEQLHLLGRGQSRRCGRNGDRLQADGSIRGCSDSACNTAKLIEVLQYASKHDWGSPTSLRWQEHPVVPFFWNNRVPLDWKAVKAKVPGNPLFLYLHTNAFISEEADGAFARNGIGAPPDKASSTWTTLTRSRLRRRTSSL